MHEAIYGRVEDICDQHVSGYKDNKAKKAEDAKRARPATWDETVRPPPPPEITDHHHQDPHTYTRAKRVPPTGPEPGMMRD